MKKENNYKVLSNLIHKYNQADEEYWSSIYELEQYLMDKLCKTEDDFVEVIDNTIRIRVKTPESEGFSSLKEYLRKNEIPYEYEVDNSRDSYGNIKEFGELIIFAEQFPKMEKL